MSGGGVRRGDVEATRVGETLRAAVLAAAVAAAAYLAIGRVAEPPLATAVQNLMLVSAPLVAAATAWARVGVAGPRRLWLYLAGYCVLWAVGQGIWAYHEWLGAPTAPFPVWSAGALGVALPCGVAAAFAVPRRRAYRVRIILDALIVELSLLLIAWQVAAPALIPSGRLTRDVVLGFGLILGDAAVVAAVVAATPGRSHAWRSPARFVMWGLTAIAAADVAFVFLALTGRYSTGTPSDVGWVCGFVFIAAGAALVRPSEPNPLHEPAVAPDRISPWLLALPYVFVVPAILTTYWLQATDGAVPPPLLWIGGGVVAALVIRQIITLLENERRSQELDRRVSSDLLTGLWNRETLRRHVDQMLGHGGVVAVILVDIDNFSAVNDLHGRGGGDAVLVELARRLQCAATAPHGAARIGSDEFAVALPSSVGLPQVVALAANVVERMREPVMVGDSSMTITVSVGIATASSPLRADALLRRADFATTAAKQRGKDRYELYEPDLHADAVERIALAQELDRALNEHEFVLHYQPVYDLAGGRIVGAEALIRWDHPTRGRVQPAEFISVAETSAHIHAIGRWALHESCRLLQRLRDAALVSEDFYIAVNVSPKQLLDATFPEAVTAALTAAEVPGEAIVLELTESSLMDADVALPILSDLRARGVRLAVDDFGTGYSSLAYLHRFPIDVVKIDRAFVARVDEGVEGRAVAHAILVLAGSLHLETVAEGVERATQQGALLTLGCQRGQGYFFSEPIAEEQLLDVIRAVPAETGRRRVPQCPHQTPTQVESRP